MQFILSDPLERPIIQYEVRAIHLQARRQDQLGHSGEGKTGCDSFDRLRNESAFELRFYEFDF